MSWLQLKIHSWNKGPIINEDAIVALNVPLVEVISIFKNKIIVIKKVVKIIFTNA